MIRFFVHIAVCLKTFNYCFLLCCSIAVGVAYDVFEIHISPFVYVRCSKRVSTLVNRLVIVLAQLTKGLCIVLVMVRTCKPFCTMLVLLDNLLQVSVAI